MSRWLGWPPSACSRGGRRVFSRSRASTQTNETKCRSTFQSSASIMFANVPLAQASHMARPRSKRWTKKLYLLTGEAVKYCGHFLPTPLHPSMESLAQISVKQSTICQQPGDSHRDVHFLVSRVEQNTVEKRQIPTTESSSSHGNGSWRIAGRNQEHANGFS